MRALGIDLGTKKIGIALTDSLKMFASGFDTFEVIKNDYEDFIEYLKNMFERYRNDFDVIVLGYPTHMNGDKTPWTIIVEQFSKKLKSNFPNCKVVLEDERRSTLNTTENLKNIGLKSGKIKKIKDKMSAVTILQNYLDRI